MRRSAGAEDALPRNLSAALRGFPYHSEALPRFIWRLLCLATSTECAGCCNQRVTTARMGSCVDFICVSGNVKQGMCLLVRSCACRSALSSYVTSEEPVHRAFSSWAHPSKGQHDGCSCSSFAASCSPNTAEVEFRRCYPALKHPGITATGPARDSAAPAPLCRAAPPGSLAQMEKEVPLPSTSASSALASWAGSSSMSRSCSSTA